MAPRNSFYHLSNIENLALRDWRQLIWVKQSASDVQARCPLWVHKRTFAVQKGMSALPPKADIDGWSFHVRFVP